MNTRSGGRRKKQAKFFGLPSEKLHYGRTKPKRVKDFSCKSRDGRELKIYIGTGCVPSDFGINELMMKSPQFTVYDKVSLGSAFNRLKRQANSLSFERKNKKNGKLYTILYIKLLLSIFIIIKNFIYNFFSAFGFSAYSNYDEDDDSDYKDDGFDLDDDISEFCDTITGISELDAGTSAIINSGYYNQDASIMTVNKSRTFLARKKRSKSSPTSILKNSPNANKKPTKHFSPSFIPEYVIDVWKDTRPNNRC